MGKARYVSLPLIYGDGNGWFDFLKTPLHAHSHSHSTPTSTLYPHPFLRLILKSKPMWQVWPAAEQWQRSWVSYSACCSDKHLMGHLKEGLVWVRGSETPSIRVEKACRKSTGQLVTVPLQPRGRGRRILVLSLLLFTQSRITARGMAPPQ